MTADPTLFDEPVDIRLERIRRQVLLGRLVEPCDESILENVDEEAILKLGDEQDEVCSLQLARLADEAEHKDERIEELESELSTAREGLESERKKSEETRDETGRAPASGPARREERAQEGRAA
jgi:hypothetical protein